MTDAGDGGHRRRCGLLLHTRVCEATGKRGGAPAHRWGGRPSQTWTRLPCKPWHTQGKRPACYASPRRARSSQRPFRLRQPPSPHVSGVPVGLSRFRCGCLGRHGTLTVFAQLVLLRCLAVELGGLFILAVAEREHPCQRTPHSTLSPAPSRLPWQPGGGAAPAPAPFSFFSALAMSPNARSSAADAIPALPHAHHTLQAPPY